LLKTTKTKPKKTKLRPELANWGKVTDRLHALRVEGEPNTWISGMLTEHIDNAMSTTVPQGKVWKLMSVLKMAQFYNPLFLPAYDLFQHTMMGMSPLRIPDRMIRAAIDVFTRSDNYLEALSNTVASKPYSMPFKQIQSTADRLANQGTQGKILSIVKPVLRASINPKNAFFMKPLYEASWHTAWKLDETIRMMSYNALRSKGFNKADAAHAAARFHGDYASVPAKTRKALNKIFFTPTFKIAMGKLYIDMMKGAIASAGGLKGTKLQKRFAMGLLSTAAINVGFHLLFTQIWGMEDDELGRRYYKEFDTDLGPRELVITYSNPANMFLKYIYMGRKLHNMVARGSENIVKSVWDLTKWDLHPTYRILADLLFNTMGGGDKILNEFDSPVKNLSNGLSFLAKEFIGMSQVLIGDEATKGMRDARLKLLEDFGHSWRVLEHFMFAYSRKTKDERTGAQIRMKLQRLRRANMKLARDNDGEINEEWIENAQKQIELLERELD
jgi:hypothetical protein